MNRKTQCETAAPCCQCPQCQSPRYSQAGYYGPDWSPEKLMPPANARDPRGYRCNDWKSGNASVHTNPLSPSFGPEGRSGVDIAYMASRGMVFIGGWFGEERIEPVEIPLLPFLSGLGITGEMVLALEEQEARKGDGWERSGVGDVCGVAEVAGAAGMTE